MKTPDGLKPATFTLTAAVMPAVRECEAARVFSGPKGDPSPAAWWGIGIHLFMKYAGTRDREFALEYIDRKFPRASRCCYSIDTAQIPEGTHETNLAFSVESRSAVRGKTTLSTSEHVMGRADLTYSVDDAPYENAVLDWKTGKGELFPDDDAQLLVLAAALWMENPSEMHKPIHGALVRILSNGDLSWYRTQFTPEKMDAFVKEARKLVLLIDESREDCKNGATPEFVPGPHCKACFCALACPHATEEAVKYKQGR